MFKKFLISAVFGAAALGTLPATAAPPMPTPAERATIKKLEDFNACVITGMNDLQTKIKSAVDPIMEARLKAANAATIEAAKGAEMTQDQAEQLAKAMEESTKAPEAKILIELLLGGEDDPRVTCGKQIGIGNDNGLNEEFKKSIEALTKKYPGGPKTVPAAPQPN